MKAPKPAPFRFVLPLPTFTFHPLTAALIAATHVYLAAEHLLKLFGGEVTWTNIWKGFGALAGAYVFAALASRGLAKREGHPPRRATEEIAGSYERRQIQAETHPLS